MEEINEPYNNKSCGGKQMKFFYATNFEVVRDVL